MPTSPKNVTYNPNTGKLSFSGSPNNNIFNPLNSSRTMKRGPVGKNRHIQPPAGYAFIRGIPGTQMMNLPDIFGIGPILSSPAFSE